MTREGDLSAGLIAGFTAALLPDPWRPIVLVALVGMAWLSRPVLNWRAGREREARARHYRSTGEDHDGSDEDDPEHDHRLGT